MDSLRFNANPPILQVPEAARPSPWSAAQQDGRDAKRIRSGEELNVPVALSEARCKVRQRVPIEAIRNEESRREDKREWRLAGLFPRGLRQLGRGNAALIGRWSLRSPPRIA